MACVTHTVKLGYLLYLPPEYDAEKKDRPPLVFLHGSGERGSDLEKVTIHGPKPTRIRICTSGCSSSGGCRSLMGFQARACECVQAMHEPK